MPISADEVFVPYRLIEGSEPSDNQARCLGCDEPLYWNEDVQDYWVNHTMLECIQRLRWRMG